MNMMMNTLSREDRLAMTSTPPTAQPIEDMPVQVADAEGDDASSTRSTSTVSTPAVRPFSSLMQTYQTQLETAGQDSNQVDAAISAVFDKFTATPSLLSNLSAAEQRQLLAFFEEAGARAISGESSVGSVLPAIAPALGSLASKDRKIILSLLAETALSLHLKRPNERYKTIQSMTGGWLDNLTISTPETLRLVSALIQGGNQTDEGVYNTLKQKLETMITENKSLTVSTPEGPTRTMSFRAFLFTYNTSILDQISVTALQKLTGSTSWGSGELIEAGLLLARSPENLDQSDNERISAYKKETIYPRFQTEANAWLSSRLTRFRPSAGGGKLNLFASPSVRRQQQLASLLTAIDPKNGFELAALLQNPKATGFEADLKRISTESPALVAMATPLAVAADPQAFQNTFFPYGDSDIWLPSYLQVDALLNREVAKAVYGKDTSALIDLEENNPQAYYREVMHLLAITASSHSDGAARFVSEMQKDEQEIGANADVETVAQMPCDFSTYIPTTTEDFRDLLTVATLPDSLAENAPFIESARQAVNRTLTTTRGSASRHVADFKKAAWAYISDNNFDQSPFNFSVGAIEQKDLKSPENSDDYLTFLRSPNTLKWIQTHLSNNDKTQLNEVQASLEAYAQMVSKAYADRPYQSKRAQLDRIKTNLVARFNGFVFKSLEGRSDEQKAEQVKEQFEKMINKAFAD